MSESNSQADAPDKNQLYGRYQGHSDKISKIDVKDREWKSKLQKQVAHKALDEPIMGEEMGDIYAPKTITNTGLSGKGLLGLAALALPLMGVGGAGAAVLLNQWLNRDSPPAVVQPVQDTDTDTLTVPNLKFGPERD